MKAAFPIALLICFSLVGQTLAAQTVSEDRWARLKTSHFEMYTSGDESKSRDVILHFERVREFFMQASPVKPPGEFPTRIVAFKNPQVMHVYAPNQSVVAYYAPGPVRDSIVMQNPAPDAYPVAIHEYLHLVIRHSGLKLPVWVNEGWAEVYSTMKSAKDGVAVGDLIPRHMTALEQGRWFSLEQLQAITVQSPDYNETARSGIFYAESWALVHMLYLSPDYKDNFGKFIGALNRGLALPDATKAAYGKTLDQVFQDLRGYLLRKKLYGTVFLTPYDKSRETPEMSSVSVYDVYLMLADLHAASHHPVDAARGYKQLQEDDPKRPEAFTGAGYLALQLQNRDTARAEFHKAFALGSDDPQMCMQLAALDRLAKQPSDMIMAELSRAIELRPDFTEAIFELALMKVDARDFDAAWDLLGKVGMVGVDRMGIFRSALAYVNLQRGNVSAARADAEAARRAAKTQAETDAATRLLTLIDARSKGPAAVMSGEKVVRVQGTAVGLRCAAPGSGTMSKMGVLVDGKQLLLDMPDAAAVEITRKSAAATELKCGPLPPFPLVVEYAPASVTNMQSAGIIRRLEF